MAAAAAAMVVDSPAIMAASVVIPIIAASVDIPILAALVVMANSSIRGVVSPIIAAAVVASPIMASAAVVVMAL
jgi:hypothetical protein